MGYIISFLLLFGLIVILIKNIFDDKKSHNNKIPIFDKLNISILSDFGFEKEKIFDIKLYDKSLVPCGNIRFFGFKEKEKGDKIAFISRNSQAITTLVEVLNDKMKADSRTINFGTTITTLLIFKTNGFACKTL